MKIFLKALFQPNTLIFHLHSKSRISISNTNPKFDFWFSIRDPTFDLNSKLNTQIGSELDPDVDASFMSEFKVGSWLSWLLGPKLGVRMQFRVHFQSQILSWKLKSSPKSSVRFKIQVGIGCRGSVLGWILILMPNLESNVRTKFYFKSWIPRCQGRISIQVYMSSVWC